MGRKARVDRTAEQKLEIVLEGLKSGNISETCRRYEIAANLYYRWKDEALQGATAALGGRSAAAAESEKERRVRHAGVIAYVSQNICLEVEKIFLLRPL